MPVSNHFSIKTKKEGTSFFGGFIKKLGPGIITGASDDDPSGILTYLQAGVLLGVQTLWTAVLTLPLMYAIQEMCARIGLVTEKGLIRIIGERAHKRILYPIAAVIVLVITINIGADLLAVGVVMEGFSGISRAFWIPSAALFVLIFTVMFSYRKFAGVLKWLTLALFFYIISVFYMHIDWPSALRATFFPSLSFGRETFFIIGAILGTTLSPYLFFWQTSEEIEEKHESEVNRRLARVTVTKNELKFMREDTFLGMLFSNIVMWFIIAGASQMGAVYGLKEIVSFEQASLVLRPILGEFAYLIFGIGLIGVGLLAIPVLAGSIGYILAEIFKWQEGMNKPFREAKGFYLAIIGATTAGMALNLLGFDPIQLLIYTAIFYTLATPPILYFILKIANDPKIMKHKTNKPWSNVLGALAFIIMTAAGIAYLFLSL